MLVPVTGIMYNSHYSPFSILNVLQEKNIVVALFLHITRNSVKRKEMTMKLNGEENGQELNQSSEDHHDHDDDYE